jgi:ribosomal protein L11 methyltransferase
VERAEAARAQMLELFPEGFEERDTPDGVELAAYTDAGGEERLWAAFGQVSTMGVPSDWEDRWRAFHRPLRVGPLWIGPPWERPDPEATAVIIDPGRAFGTGGHPTTRLCLRLLLEVGRASLLDVGCGSGVLAIAASRLGFSPVVGIDDDPVALAAARRNARANHVSIDLRRGDALRTALPSTDVVVANVSWEFAAKLGSRLRARDLIVSGYFESEQPVAERYVRMRRLTEDGWAADLLRREE